MRDLAAQQAGAVLRRGGFDAAAGVENRDDEGFQFFLDGLCQRYIENSLRAMSRVSSAMTDSLCVVRVKG